MKHSSTSTLWPFLVKLEYEDGADGFVNTTLSVQVMEGVISKSSLNPDDRLRLAIEEWVEVASVEAFNEYSGYPTPTPPADDNESESATNGKQ